MESLAVDKTHLIRAKLRAGDISLGEAASGRIVEDDGYVSGDLTDESDYED